MDGKQCAILELQRRFQRREIRRNSEIQDPIATSPIIHMERRKLVLPIGKLKFACAETSLSCQHHMELGEPSIELFSRNMTYFMSDFERKMSPPGSITDITYNGYLYRESSNVESDTSYFRNGNLRTRRQLPRIPSLALNRLIRRQVTIFS